MRHHHCAHGIAKQSQSWPDIIEIFFTIGRSVESNTGKCSRHNLGFDSHYIGNSHSFQQHFRFNRDSLGVSSLNHLKSFAPEFIWSQLR
jgi:hypothetical protein